MMMMMMICNQIRNSLPVLVRSLGMYAQHASQSVNQPPRLNVLCGRSRKNEFSCFYNEFFPAASSPGSTVELLF